MPARVTETEVKAIADGLGNKTITPQVASAHAFVDAHLLASGLSEDLLEQIELYVAAHFAVLATPSAHATGSSQSGVNISASGEFGMGLEATLFGQMAKRLDPTGNLARVDRASTTSSTGASTATTARILAL